MPSAAMNNRAAVASAAVILSLAFAGPASASGPLSGLTDTVSSVTTGLDQTVELVGGTVETVTGGALPAPPSEPAQAAQPEQEAEPAAPVAAEPQPAAPAPAEVAPVKAVTQAVGGVVKTAVTATTSLTSAASKTAEPVLGAALGDERADTGSAVVAPALAAVADVTGEVLGTVTRVTEPVLPLTGAVLGQVGETVSTATTGVVASVDELLTPPSSQAAPAPGSGSQGGSGPSVPSPGPASPETASPQPTQRAGETRAKRPRPAAPSSDFSAPAGPELAARPGVTSPAATPRVGTADGDRHGSSLAPPVRTAVHSAGTSAAGSSTGLFFAGFAVLAGLFVLAAPALGRRLKLWPALVRPLAFVSPPERPG